MLNNARKLGVFRKVLKHQVASQSFHSSLQLTTAITLADILQKPKVTISTLTPANEIHTEIIFKTWKCRCKNLDVDNNKLALVDRLQRRKCDYRSNLLASKLQNLIKCCSSLFHYWMVFHQYQVDLYLDLFHAHCSLGIPLLPTILSSFFRHVTPHFEMDSIRFVSRCERPFDLSKLIYVHCIDLGTKKFTTVTSLPCLEICCVLRHFSFKRELAVRRLCCVLCSDNCKGKLSTAQSPVLINVKSSCYFTVTIVFCCVCIVFV